MNDRIPKILNDVQDRNSVAWRTLCDYIDQIAASGSDEFVPSEELGKDLFFQIYTLPKSISKLKKVKKVGLYGSKLKRLLPEIGQMESLEYLDLYTSYDLHWLPYE
ncbi:MAG: leucine-rich repeat domain-containing protein, partial [Bacteroidota bacterium]